MKIKILHADDNALFRELLREGFEKTADLEVVAEANSLYDIYDKVNLIKVDIVLTDVFTPGLNGILTTKELQVKNPQVKVVALTNYFEKNVVKEIMEAKAWGYLNKNISFENLCSSIRQIHEGRKCISQEIQNALIEDYLDRGIQKKTPLTKREMEILKLLAEGRSIKEISEKYFISIKTAGTHKHNIFEKMGFDNLAQLIKYAIKTGIVS